MFCYVEAYTRRPAPAIRHSTSLSSWLGEVPEKQEGHSVMKRIFVMLALAALTVAALSVSGLSAFAAPKACSAGDPGCKTERSTETTHETGGQSGGFNVTNTETQRGNVDAQGTQSTEQTSSTCTGPSGNTLRAGHPQCS